MKEEQTKFLMVDPEQGVGALAPLCKAEEYFNYFIEKLPILSAIFVIAIALFISIDVTGRLLFNKPWVGITDLESLFMVVVGFCALAGGIMQRRSIQIDLFYDQFSSKIQRIMYLMASCIGTMTTAILTWRGLAEGLHWGRKTGVLLIPEQPFILFTFFCIGLACIAFFFQVCHSVRSMLNKKEYTGILIGIGIAVLLFSLPIIYKIAGIHLTGLALGSLGFLLLMILLLLRVPLGWTMAAIGIIGLLMIKRTPEAAFNAFASTAFTQTTNFTVIAIPMFMLMGEMVSLSGLSDDLFNAAEKWLGRLPGGLAIASVGGCAGFGAVCGDSMATVITMSSVALPAMKKNNYDMSLACGSLAAGGTLGILIPPSMGFIFFSMITEVSVGKLFVAGILPGLLLTFIFMVIIAVQVKRNPSLAPPTSNYPLSVKLFTLVKIIPVVILFLVVVMGILYGKFTPAEGGALGAVMAFAFAAVRGRLSIKTFSETMYRAAIFFGMIFALFAGLFILQTFLTSSRLPNLLAELVVGLDVNKYAILGAVILLYIFLGCVMNIMAMMMLTLPAIFPTIEALGFDGVWFGVVCVIVMEMGMITPPVGMNVFTMGSLAPDVPTMTIFKGVMPFFLGMLLCTLLIIIFPQIALVFVK